MPTSSRAPAPTARISPASTNSAPRWRSLKPERIAGCGGLATRHDAMLAAEAGADYVMFGEPDVGGHRPSFDAILERVEWWAEVFEIPCVGLPLRSTRSRRWRGAGADFVAVGAFIFDDPRGLRCAL